MERSTNGTEAGRLCTTVAVGVPMEDRLRNGVEEIKREERPVT
jgi:hypothetical protein